MITFGAIRSITHLRRALPDERACRRQLEKLRWLDGRYCPHCGSTKSWPIRGESTRNGLYECAGCDLQFTVTTKTPLHSTKLPLRTWIEAMFMVLTSSKGIESVALARLTSASARRPPGR